MTAALPETHIRAGSVSKSRYGAWLVAFSAPMIIDGEDVEFEAASSLAKAKQALRTMAENSGFCAPWHWYKHPAYELYFLEGKLPEVGLGPTDGEKI
jgi:hypothetical protein